MIGVKGKGRVKAGRARPALSNFRGLKNASTLRKDPILKTIHALAVAEGAEVYLVGGLIRNLLLSAESVPDYDFAIKDDLEGFSKKAAVMIKGTAFILDKKTPSYRAVAKRGGTNLTLDFSPIKKGGIVYDLKKRDFTVNAAAISLSALFGGENPLLDPLEGAADAGKKRLRAASATALKDDPLRCLRAVRLSQQYGLRIDPATIKLIKESSRLLKRTSAERIRDELVIVFANPGAAESMALFYELGIMKAILPGIAGWGDVEGYDLLTHSLKTLAEAEKMLSRLSSRTFPKFHKELRTRFEGPAGPFNRSAFLKLCAFLHDTGKPLTISREEGRLRFIGHDFEGAGAAKDLLRRLKFSRALINDAANLIRNHHRVFMLAKLKERTLRSKAHLVRASGDEAVIDLLFLSLADARATRGGEDKGLFKLVKEMIGFYYGVYKKKRPRPILNGREIMKAFSVPEGRLVGEIMRKIAEGVESGAIENKRQALQYVRNWLSKENA